MKNNEVVRIGVDDICISPSRRAINDATVAQLASSMEKIGLQHPITVRFVQGFDDPEYGAVENAVVLVAGRHRLEAARRLGWETVDGIYQHWTDAEARMWEIAENLHRADLTKLERAEQIAEWIRLSDGVSAQCEPKPQGGRPESGTNKAARELGIDRVDAQRSKKVASLSEDAKEVARETGLDHNQSAMLKASTKPLAEQAAAIREIAETKAAKPSRLAPEPLNEFETREAWMAYMMRGWNRAAAEWREHFFERIDGIIFDNTKMGVAVS